MTVELPPPSLPQTCWPIDTRCCEGFEDYPPETQEIATAMAGETLRALTAYRVGGCPITVRPCLSRCNPDSLITAPVPGANTAALGAGGAFNPHINAGGSWVNGCGCLRDCSCTSMCIVKLPPPVGWVGEVRLDGAILDPGAYRVDNGNELVRTDGGCWPACQDMNLPDTEEGTFSVTYLNAFLVDSVGAYAAGILACEFAKACTTGKCRLPANVTEITRQGITMTIPAGAFPDGLTGIREVDSYILRWNPYQRKMQPTVTSPDVEPARWVTSR